MQWKSNTDVASTGFPVPATSSVMVQLAYASSSQSEWPHGVPRAVP